MNTISKILLTSIFASALLTAGTIGNPHNSIANKAVKVGVANEIINPNDTALQKTVKAKAVRGDYRTNRKVRRAVR